MSTSLFSEKARRPRRWRLVIAITLLVCTAIVFLTISVLWVRAHRVSMNWRVTTQWLTPEQPLHLAYHIRGVSLGGNYLSFTSYGVLTEVAPRTMEKFIRRPPRQFRFEQGSFLPQKRPEPPTPRAGLAYHLHGFWGAYFVSYSDDRSVLPRDQFGYFRKETGWYGEIPLVYIDALALLGLLASYFWLRRSIERRRVELCRCARCGYDLRGTPSRCPECGLVPRCSPVTPPAAPGNA